MVRSVRSRFANAAVWLCVAIIFVVIKSRKFRPDQSNTSHLVFFVIVLSLNGIRGISKPNVYGS